MDLARFALEKRVISALSTILILAAGLYAYTALPRFEDPEFIIRQAQIITPYPGASAAEVADEVTDAIETALQQLTDVKEIKSNSQPGRSTVTVEFTIPGAKTRPDLAQKFTQMRAKIDDMQGNLPPGALGSVIFDDFGDVFAQYFAIVGDGYSLPELYEYAKDLERELAVVAGVSKVTLTGIQQEVIYVEFNTARLIQLGLSLEQISDVLQGQNLVTPGGTILVGEMRLMVRATGAVGTIEAIENLVISNPATGKSYRLSDIANISRGVKEPSTHLLYRDGQPAIGMGISNVIGGNVVTMGSALNQR
ncbi:MAG: multidrug efflux pump subunit AcrB, partial [Paracoccaceae bacterium]